MPPKHRPRSRSKPQEQAPQEEAPKKSWLRWLWPVMSWSLRIGVLAAIWGGILLAVILIFYAYDMPDIRQVTQPQRRPAITMLANDGTVLAHYGDLYGEHVTLNEVPKNLVHAIIAIEDRRFYSHFGVDPIGLMRAMVKNILAGHMVQGGSTLTQQLAKNLFLTPERTLRRKAQELLLALWLEHKYSKDQILTAYLNRVYLGSGSYGVDAAAEIYFGKPVSTINLREAAIIAGLLRAPSRFSPLNDAEQSLERAQIVLGAMVECDYITEEEAKAAMVSVPQPRRKPGAGGDGHYFADWVAEQANALLSDAPQDLVVATTVDLNLQRAAERHLDAVLAASGSRNVTQGAVVTLAPDGAVRALAGGRDYGASQFNRATQAMRQPGSSFKPIIYLTALEQGLSPNDTFEDEPVTIGKWSPENYDGKYHGTVTAREALAQSINTVAVRLLQRTGIPAVIQTARDLGVASPIGHDMSLALGTNLMTPLELTGVYASIAAGGRAITPYAIKEIRNRDGQVLYRRASINAPLTVNPQSVAMLTDMMTEVVRSGTGKKATLDRPVAGKTGTSSDYRDAWFLGFTADYTTGVWLGNDDNDPMQKVTGGSLPAELWHDYMMEAEANLPPRDLLSGANGGNPALPQAVAEPLDGLERLIQGLFGEDSSGERAARRGH